MRNSSCEASAIRGLSAHATSALPAWLWSIDGSRVLWANPVGARIFGAASGAALRKNTVRPADAHRRQVARLARTLPLNGAARLERLRGFGAPLGMLVTCGCTRLDFADGSQGVLVTAAENAGLPMPLPERLQRLVEGIEAPIAAFARDGTLVGASDAARPLLCFRNLSEAGLDDARSSALIQGRVETPIGSHHMVLQRVGHGADIGLVALIAPAADQPIPHYELPAISSEAPAEFALIDEFAEIAVRGDDGSNARPRTSRPSLTPPTASPLDRPNVEASHAEAPQTKTPDPEIHQDEPSPYIEAVADEPAPPSPAEPSQAIDSALLPLADSPSWPDEPSLDPRQQPLRFTWRMDAEGRFSLDPGEFTRLIGPRTAAGFGRRWSEIAEAFGLDPDGRVLKVIATGDTWTGITLSWPVDGGGRLAVELSGLPIYDRARNLAGYRGFGVCRDLDALTQLAALRRYEFFSDPPAPQAFSADIVAAEPATGPPATEPAAEPDVASSGPAEVPASIASETSQQTDPEASVENPKERPAVSAARRVEIADPDTRLKTAPSRNSPGNCRSGSTAKTAAPPRRRRYRTRPKRRPNSRPRRKLPNRPAQRPNGRRLPSRRRAARPGATRSCSTCSLWGVLIYRLDRLLYANAAFLARMGYASLHAPGGGRRSRRALCRARRVEYQQHIGHRHAGDDFHQPNFAATGFVRRCGAGGDQCAPVHDFVGRRCRAGVDFFRHRRTKPGSRRGDRQNHPCVGAAGCRPRPCRRTRRHPRCHGRRRRDVRRRGQHQFLQPQRRSAVRLRRHRARAKQFHRADRAGKPARGQGLSGEHPGHRGRQPARSRP